ncbi:cysteate synthase [Streptomyces goshikiensis]|uniref:cysteate synthase n=1 Tax=Streptomyces goshikiensis TaxID=1942 RepID=UPI0036642F6D
MATGFLQDLRRWSSGEGRSPVSRRYLMRCVECGSVSEDDGFLLDCPVPHRPSLLRAEYAEQRFLPGSSSGLFRYGSWLPAVRRDPVTAGGFTYRAERLGHELDLDDLWVAFSGYWPERGGLLETCTFKDLQASAVLARLPEGSPTLVVASAGNTGRAFLRACSLLRVPLVLVVPDSALSALARPVPRPEYVRLVTVAGDYGDAIDLARVIADRPGFQAEGGVRNVAHRDGLGTVLLAAAEAIGRLPDCYVQAVGSGAGAIGAYEASGRLLAAGFPAARTGSCRGGPQMLLCQNRCFAPMFDAWRSGAATAAAKDGPAERAAIARAAAPELTTRTPPYAVRGGVRDVLSESGGHFATADSAETAAAQNLFQTVEGVDIEAPAGVALACLRQAAAQGRIERDATVLLHVTGGGRLRYAADHRLCPVRPTVRARGLSHELVADIVTSPFPTTVCASARGPS